MGTADPRRTPLGSVFGSVVAFSVNTVPDYHSGFPYVIPVDTSGHRLGADGAKGWLTSIVFAHKITPRD